ncbi:MAG: hypothetical protein ICV79_28795 [Flavisolibacter sp.]|nr:hypothetical protein [Flavisolibacter sp.]
MIRTVIIPDQHSVTLSLTVPPPYIGKELEVIAFTKDEGIQPKETDQKQVTFMALSLDTKGYKFNRDEANER